MRFLFRRYKVSTAIQKDLAAKFERFSSSEHQFIDLVGNYGLKVGSMSLRGPVIIHQGKIFLWDVPQFGVGGISSKTPEVNDPGSPFHEWSWEAFNMFDAIDPPPEILVIGSGAKSFPFPSILSQKFKKLGTQLEVLDSKNAGGTYNLLLKEGRLVSCAILPAIPTSAKTGEILVDLLSIP